MLPLLIIIRILFITCMVFIIGYIFGGFSKKPALKLITRISAILLIVLFISTNFIIRSSSAHPYECPWGYPHERSRHSYDSTHTWHYGDNGKFKPQASSLNPGSR